MARIRMMLVVGVAVSACAGAVRTDFIDSHDGAYDGTTVRLAASRESIPLAVHGSLYPGVAGIAAAEAVVQYFRMPGWFPPGRFRPASLAEAQNSAYSLVFVVDPLRPMAVDVCSSAERVPLLPAASEITVLAVFCSSGGMATHSFARAAQSAPGTAAFRQLFEQISISLFPSPQFSN